MNHLQTHGQLNDIFAMACGRFTPTQRQIARDRCKVPTAKYVNLLSWLIQNHPGYFNMTPPTTCPQPTLLGFEISNNNTDVSDNTCPQENIVETVRFSYSPANEAQESTGNYSNEADFISSEIKGQKPTLLFKKGNQVFDHLIKMEELFATKFPFGRGGLHETRDTKVSDIACLKHYSRIALPNFQTSDLLLVTCSLCQRLKAFQRCCITCKSPFNGMTVGEKLSQVTLSEIEEAGKDCVNGMQTKNKVLSKLFSSIKGHFKSIRNSNEAAMEACQKLFSL